MQSSSFLSGFGRFLESKTTGRFLNFVLIPLLLMLALLLPPIELGQRLQTIGYTLISPTQGEVRDPDGTRVIVPADGLVAGSETYLKFDSVPRADFERGDTEEDLRRAAAALPGHLRPRSPVYRLALRGSAPTRVVVTIPIPNDSLPYETLDVYNWNGERWEWIPNRLIPEEEVLESDLPFLPTAFMVVQTAPLLPTVGVELPRGKTLPSAAAAATTILFPTVLTLRGDGSVDGVLDLPSTAGTTYKTFATVRNYEPGQIPRTDLLANLLIDEEMQTIHISTLAEIAASGLYDGVALDFRGVDPPLKADFVRFVGNLARRLHEDGKQLALFLDVPVRVAVSTWETFGYDWRALGAIADLIIVPGPDNPLAYAPGGEVEDLLNWATDEINRSKVLLRLPARTVEQADNYFLFRGYQEVLAPLTGAITTSDQVLLPGETLQAAVQSRLVATPLQFDPTTGISWYRYRGQSGEERVVFLEDAASLAYKVSLANRFHLAGVYVESLQSEDLDPATWDVLRSYAAGNPPALREQSLGLSWTVSDEQGTVVAQAETGLQEPVQLAVPDQPGTYKIKVALMKDGQPVMAQEVPVPVATYTPTPTPTPEFTPTPTPTPTATPLPFAVAVAVDTTNLRQGPGTNYPLAGRLNAGQQLKIIGKNQNGSWWQLEGTDGKPVWIIASRVRTLGPVEAVAVAQNIPTPPPVTVAQQPAPSSGGSNPPAPRPAGGGSFGYGIQIQPYGGADIAFAANAIKGMGFNWVKWQVPWKYLEPAPGQIDLSEQERLVSFFHGQGLNILASIVKAPNWSRPPNTDLSVEGPPADPQTFANFLAVYARQFCGRVQAIEVWNEQNLHYEWGNEPLDPARYMELLKRAYAAIKGACPQMYVISGALTPAGDVGALAIDDFKYLEAMYQHGLKNYADGIGAHPSGYNVPPSLTWQQACDYIRQKGTSFRGPCDSPHHSWSARSTMEGYRNIMLKYGDVNKRIWPTEFGWAAGGALHPAYGYANDNSYEEQARWTVEFYQMMKNWGFVGPAFLWNLNFHLTNPGTELAQWGIWGRPTYDALRNMPK